MNQFSLSNSNPETGKECAEISYFDVDLKKE